MTVMNPKIGAMFVFLGRAILYEIVAELASEKAGNHFNRFTGCRAWTARFDNSTVKGGTLRLFALSSFQFIFQGDRRR